ncbi:60S ribosomal protein L7-2 [Acorus calamus]|uniref:60S ribosomal protein L7-2 n=1 Tax=Acorus calamus TaxID=4465 RepID=A0AAV9D0G9_ACOCL|nr:60S ribosomal protein L7-2 [Acorus calamus]
MAEEEPKPLTYIPETVLKKRKNNEDWAVKRRERLAAQRLRSKEDKKLVFKRAEQFIKDYRDKELDLIQMKHRVRRQKLKKPVQTDRESKLLFVIRIRGKTDMHATTRKFLHKMRLGQIFHGVFLKENEGTLSLLQRVQPYVTYGYPNLKNVRELVFKKGHGKIDKQRVPLTDNNVIEQALGKYNILCLEDIVHEIATAGPHFKEVSSFLWPFKLSRPEGSLTRKKTLYEDGGDTGNRGDHINELINTMN